MNRLGSESIDRLFDCFRASMGVRAAARATGITRNTAAKYLRLFETREHASVLCLCGKPRHVGWCKAQENAERIEAFCGCGLPVRHRGWCRVRLARSPERQEFLRARWGKLRNGVTPIDATIILPASNEVAKVIEPVVSAVSSTRIDQSIFDNTPRPSKTYGPPAPRAVPISVPAPVKQTVKPTVKCAIPTFTEDEKRALTKQRFAVQRRGRANPVTSKELSAIAAASSVPIKKLPIGASADWRPSWLTNV